MYEQTKVFIGNLDFEGDDKMIVIILLLIAIFFFVLGTCVNSSADDDTNTEKLADDDTNTEKLLDHLFYSGKISKQQYIYYIDKYTDGRKVKRTKLL